MHQSLLGLITFTTNTQAMATTYTQRQALALARVNNISEFEFYQAYGNEPWETYDREEIEEWVWANKQVPM